MTLDLIVPSYANRTPMDRASPELRAYVSSEWGGDDSWLYTVRPRSTLRSRLHEWLASRSLRLPPPSSSAQPRRSVESVAALAQAAAREPCLHPSAEDLGLSGGAVFLRCLLCGDVLVVDRGRRWSLRSDVSAIREDPVRV